MANLSYFSTEEQLRWLESEGTANQGRATQLIDVVFRQIEAWRTFAHNYSSVQPTLEERRKTARPYLEQAAKWQRRLEAVCETTGIFPGKVEHA